MPKLLAIGQTAELKAKKTEVESGVNQLFYFIWTKKFKLVLKTIGPDRHT